MQTERSNYTLDLDCVSYGVSQEWCLVFLKQNQRPVFLYIPWETAHEVCNASNPSFLSHSPAYVHGIWKSLLILLSEQVFLVFTV